VVTPSLFTRGGLENICGSLAQRLVGPSSVAFPTTDTATAIHNMVTQLMGLTTARSADAAAILQGHFTDAMTQSSDPVTSLQSTFILACLSPYVAGIGQ
jgi:energy-converting hydrogenase Eha subunit A